MKTIGNDETKFVASVSLAEKFLSKVELNLSYFVQRQLLSNELESSPVFIVGCGHSGTTLLLKILNSHSRIYAIPFESDFTLKPLETQHYYLKLFDKMAIASGKKRWVEKSPKNIRNIQRLIDLFPDAKILVMIRDGRDVACSLRDRYGDMEAGASRWVSDNGLAEPFLQLKNTLLVRYEHIVANFEASVTEILAFLEEEFEPGLESFHEKKMNYQIPYFNRLIPSISSRKLNKANDITPQNHLARRTWQVHQALFDGRGKWKQTMTAEEKQLFKQLAGEKLIQYGYVADDAW